MDCSPPGSSVQGIFQARIQEWVAISFFRGSSWLRGFTCNWRETQDSLESPALSRRFFTAAPTGKPLLANNLHQSLWHRRKWKHRAISSLSSFQFVLTHQYVKHGMLVEYTAPRSEIKSRVTFAQHSHCTSKYTWMHELQNTNYVLSMIPQRG